MRANVLTQTEENVLSASELKQQIMNCLIVVTNSMSFKSVSKSVGTLNLIKTE